MIYRKADSTNLDTGGILEVIEQRIASGDRDSFLLLVPTRARVKDIEQKLLNASPNGALVTPPIYTLADLAFGLLRRVRPDIRLITDAESSVFLELAIQALHKQNALKYFEHHPGNPRALPLPRGTFETVLNTIRALKRSGQTPETLKHELGQVAKAHPASTEVLRSHDIHLIFSAYEQQLGDLLTDTYGAFQLLRRSYANSGVKSIAGRTNDSSLDSVFRSAFPEVREVFVEGFLRFENPEYDLLHELSLLDGIDVYVELLTQTTNHKLFGAVERIAERLEAQGFVRNDSRSDVPREASPSDSFRVRLADSLFTRSFGPKQDRLDCTSSVHVWKGRTRMEEVENIARAIKVIYERDPLVRADLSRICIATFIESDYTPLFREVFARFEIPVNVMDRFKLDNAQVLSGLLLFLEMANHGIRKRDLVRTLSNPNFTFESVAGTKIDAANMMRVVVKYRLSGNDSDWIEALHDRFEVNAHSILTGEGIEDERGLQDLEREQVEIKKGLEDLQSMRKLLEPFKYPMYPREFKEHLHTLLLQTKILERLLASSEVTLEAGYLEIETRGYRTFVKLVEDLDSLFRLIGAEEEKLGLSFYLDRLRTASLLSRFNPRFEPGRVHVTSLEQTQGLSFDYMFVAGLADSKFPSSYEPQIFLLDALQKDGEQKQLEEERLLFFSAITNWTKELYLSYSSEEEQKLNASPSPFLRALTDIAVVNEAVPPVFTHGLFSYKDVYSHASLWIQKDGSSVAPAEFAKAIGAPEGSKYLEVLAQIVPTAVRAERARADRSNTPYRGNLEVGELDAESRDNLLRYGEHVWSVSQLETYATCPFKYFVGNILRLDIPEDPEEGLDAREKGNVVHELLREFMTKRRDNKLPDWKVLDEAGFAEAYREADALGDERLQELSQSHPYRRLEAESLLGGGGHSKESVLHKFIRTEKRISDYSLRPAYFEVSFGGKTGSKSESDSRLQSDEAIRVGKILLRGKIDRIDIDQEHGLFSILDYKTGRTPSQQRIRRGVSLQLPLYLKVAEGLLRRELGVGLTGVGGLYYKVMEEKRVLGIAVKDFMEDAFEKLGQSSSAGRVESLSELQSLIEETIHKSEAYVNGVTEGTFPLVWKDQVTTSCKSCGYRNACRVNAAIEDGVIINPTDHPTFR